jgi:hypothetical protein
MSPVELLREEQGAKARCTPVDVDLPPSAFDVDCKYKECQALTFNQENSKQTKNPSVFETIAMVCARARNMTADYLMGKENEEFKSLTKQGQHNTPFMVKRKRKARSGDNGQLRTLPLLVAS